MCIKKLAFAFVSLFALAFPQTLRQTDDKDILYLSTANSHTSDEQVAAISNALPDNFRLYRQSLDRNLYRPRAGDKWREWAFDFIDFSKYDAVVTGDDFAFEFPRGGEADFIGRLPLVCIGTGGADFAEHVLELPNAALVKDETFLDENIKLAMSLFPGKKKIAFIGCSEEQIHASEADVKKYDVEAEFKNVRQMRYGQIEEYAASVTDGSIIFLPSPKEMTDAALNTEQILDAVLSGTESPVFVCHDIGVGDGVLGGYFVSTEELGNAAVRALGQTLAPRHEAETDAAPQQTHANYFFDYAQMQRFKIKRASLNSKTIFINDNYAERARRSLLAASLAFSLLLLAALATLAVLVKRKMNSLNVFLNEERIKLNAVLSQSDTLFWECDFSLDRNDTIDIYKRGRNGEADGEESVAPSDNILEGWIDRGQIPFEYIDNYNKMLSSLKSGADSVSIDLPLKQEDVHTHLTNTRWKRIVYKNLNRNNSKVIKVIAIATDITTQKLAEEKYEGEMTYRAFVNKEHPVYTRLNLTNNIIMERMVNIPEMGLSTADSTADSELEVFARIGMNNGQNPALPAALNRKELLTAFMNGNRSHEWEFSYSFANGTISWYLLHAEISLNPYTACVEADIYLHEITHQKIMEISKNSVLDEEVEYILWLDLSDTKCHLIHNARNANWLDIKDEADYNALVQKIMSDVVTSKDQTAAQEFFALRNLTVKLKDKSASNCTFEIVTENLRVAIKQMRAYYLTSNQNVILFICRDITDITLFEKLQNEKLSRAIEQAEKANASKSDFLSRMSHDLRTPMNGIIGMAELAEDEVNQPEALQEDIRKIKSSSKYMLGLLNDILDMAKIESGKMEIRKSRQSVGEILEAIITMAAPMFESKGIHFQCNVDADQYKNFFVNVDRLHLQQVVMNLLSNASKFTPSEGTVRLLLKMLERTEKEVRVEISVSDTGSGMTKEFQKVMFDSFTQDVNSINKVGTGLGLSIVKSLVQLMNGTIECDSEPGKGTTFTIRLALEFIEERTDAPQKKADEKAVAETALEGKKILLVEDNLLNQEISRRILQKKGMIVTLAENGQVALDTFAQSEPNTFDLVLMDMMMPVMGGIESASKIRALEREDAKTVPIIALTANAFTEDIQKCLDAGMNSHLSKPINPVLLIKTIREYVAEK